MQAPRPQVGWVVGELLGNYRGRHLGKIDVSIKHHQEEEGNAYGTESLRNRKRSICHRCMRPILGRDCFHTSVPSYL